MASADETQVLKWPKDSRRWWLQLVAKPDIEKEDYYYFNDSTDFIDIGDTKQ